MDIILESPRVLGYVVAALIIVGWWAIGCKIIDRSRLRSKLTPGRGEAPLIERPRRRLPLDES